MPVELRPQLVGSLREVTTSKGKKVTRAPGEPCRIAEYQLLVLGSGGPAPEVHGAARPPVPGAYRHPIDAAFLAEGTGQFPEADAEQQQQQHQTQQLTTGGATTSGPMTILSNTGRFKAIAAAAGILFAADELLSVALMRRP